jgi:hypothetical protein
MIVGCCGRFVSEVLRIPPNGEAARPTVVAGMESEYTAAWASSKTGCSFCSPRRLLSGEEKDVPPKV